MNRFVVSLAMLTVAAAAQAQAQAQVTVKEPWVRATVAQQKATGAFLQIHSTQGAQLVSARSPVAGVVEIHEMAMDGNVMRMRALPRGLPLPAGKVVELKPGGYHLMLMDLKGPIQDGQSVPLTLVIESKDGQKQTLEVKATARPLNAAAPSEPNQSGHHHGLGMPKN
jgi:periplasmic copper chaperone A